MRKKSVKTLRRSRTGSPRVGNPRVGGPRPGSSRTGSSRTGGARLGKESASLFADAPTSKSEKPRSEAARKTEERKQRVCSKHRLQKVLAAAGFGSRRACEELITAGRVEVDRKTVTQLGTQVDPTSSSIRVDGQLLRKTRPVYVALFKPKGYLCTNQDQKGRKRAIDLIPESFGRLFSVGRLDLNSEGLLIFTNDGALADRLTHPRYGVPKVYRVQVVGTVERKTIDALKKGIYLSDGFVKADEVIIKGHHKQSTILEITLREGKNREVRRILAHVNHKVVSLIRYSIGPIKIGKMLPGDFRVLTPREVSSLYTAADREKKERD